jgi:hypothetical protein
VFFAFLVGDPAEDLAKEDVFSACRQAGREKLFKVAVGSSGAKKSYQIAKLAI